MPNGIVIRVVVENKRMALVWTPPTDGNAVLFIIDDIGQCGGELKVGDWIRHSYTYNNVELCKRIVAQLETTIDDHDQLQLLASVAYIEPRRFDNSTITTNRLYWSPELGVVQLSANSIESSRQQPEVFYRTWVRLHISSNDNHNLTPFGLRVTCIIDRILDEVEESSLLTATGVLLSKSWTSDVGFIWSPKFDMVLVQSQLAQHIAVGEWIVFCARTADNRTGVCRYVVNHFYRLCEWQHYPTCLSGCTLIGTQIIIPHQLSSRSTIIAPDPFGPIYNVADRMTQMMNGKRILIWIRRDFKDERAMRSGCRWKMHCIASPESVSKLICNCIGVVVWPNAVYSSRIADIAIIATSNNDRSPKQGSWIRFDAISVLPTGAQSTSSSYEIIRFTNIIELLPTFVVCNTVQIRTVVYRKSNNARLFVSDVLGDILDERQLIPSSSDHFDTIVCKIHPTNGCNWAVNRLILARTTIGTSINDPASERNLKADDSQHDIVNPSNSIENPSNRCLNDGEKYDRSFGYVIELSTDHIARIWSSIYDECLSCSIPSSFQLGDWIEFRTVSMIARTDSTITNQYECVIDEIVSTQPKLPTRVCDGFVEIQITAIFSSIQLDGFACGWSEQVGKVTAQYNRISSSAAFDQPIAVWIIRCVLPHIGCNWIVSKYSDYQMYRRPHRNGSSDHNRCTSVVVRSIDKIKHNYSNY